MTRALLTAALLAGCYAPDARDCTVTCAASSQCLQGQVCGTDGFCAAPKAAGHCSTIDAAAPEVSLVITIEGSGRVTIETVGSCDGDTAPHHTCMFAVASNTPRVLDAIAKDEDHPFQSWSQACAGSGMTCAMTPVSSPTQVGAKFQ
jgi:hypothetical protein